MANKFGRNYNLSITPNVAAANIVITPPFTIEFDIERNIVGSLNNALIRIYNLSQRNRELILKDSFDFSVDRSIVLKAGYGDALYSIFSGTIFSAFSRREGVNYITEISAQSGGYSVPNNFYNRTIAGGTANQEVIQDMAENMKSSNLNIGAIGTFDGESSRAKPYCGNTFSLLQELTGGGTFIDQNNLYCLNTNETLSTPDPLIIDSANGLLGTPQREQNTMVVPIVFTPQINPGELINLQSTTIEQNIGSVSTDLPNKSYNGIQKVNLVRHRGTISDAVCGDLMTEIGIIFGTNLVEVARQSQ